MKGPGSSGFGRLKEESGGLGGFRTISMVLWKLQAVSKKFLDGLGTGTGASRFLERFRRKEEVFGTFKEVLSRFERISEVSGGVRRVFSGGWGV